MQQEEGITFDRNQTWTSKSAAETGANGFVAIKTLKKPYEGTVFGVPISLKAGTKLLVKYVGLTKYFIPGYIDGDNNFSTLDDDTSVSKDEIKKVMNMLLQDLNEMLHDETLTDDDSDQECSDNLKEKAKQILMKNGTEEVFKELAKHIKDKKCNGVLNYFEYIVGDFEDGEIGRLVRADRNVTKKVLLEAKLQQEAATLGVAPKVYGYDENSKQWCMVSEFLPGSLYYRKQIVNATNSARKQLVACCHILDNAGIMHDDLKPDNYRTKDGKLYIIDYGLAKKFNQKIKVNLTMLFYGGFSFHSRRNNGQFALSLRIDPHKLEHHQKYEKYDNEKAKQNKYKINDVVLLDYKTSSGYNYYMLYRCRSKEQQDRIGFPIVEEEFDDIQSEKIYQFIKYSKLEEKLNKYYLSGYYFKEAKKLVEQTKAGEKNKYIHPFDRPAWEPLWVHPTIPFSVEECLEYYAKKGWEQERLSKIRF